MLYFLPTPIGNLSDISAHCLEILKGCEIVICEDTRVAKSLLNLLGEKFGENFGKKEFFALHSHNEKDFFIKFDAKNLGAKICVYMSDAGMPCISDPGAFLVKFAQKNGINYEILSGANAAILAAAASGLIEKEFSFLGFLPNTGTGRQIALENALNSPFPVIIYESPKRILSLIENIAKIAPQREIFAIKEATKKFERKFFGSATFLLTALKGANLNGEWCVVVDKSPTPNTEKITLNDVLSLEIPPRQKAKLIAKITGESVKKVYENLMK